VIAAVAEFERDLLIERTQSGIIRAKAAGKQLGRPPALTAKERAAVAERLNAGTSIAEIAREFNTSRQTIMRVRETALKLQQGGWAFWVFHLKPNQENSEGLGLQPQLSLYFLVLFQ